MPAGKLRVVGVDQTLGDDALSIGVVAPLLPRGRAVVLRIVAINVTDTGDEEKPEMAGAKVVMITVMQEPTRCGIGCQCDRHRP
jgi:hypothetical protein